MTTEKTNLNSKTVLVVGATGNTGFPLVKQLLARGYNLRIIVRSLDKFPQELLENSKLKIIKASLLDLSDEQMLEAVKGCAAVASCLGKNVSGKHDLRPHDDLAAKDFFYRQHWAIDLVTLLFKVVLGAEFLSWLGLN